MAYYHAVAQTTSHSFYTDRADKAKFQLRNTREPFHTRRLSDVRSSGSSSPELTPSRAGSTVNHFTPLRSTVACSVCGKKYKHRSCLSKHLWEHHESWGTCLKYNLTKHQQVQMMEAAQILIDMLNVA
ncbi:hypothetical protein H4R35_007323 [Dimargaris xerosporica]|nr:hypothetical protein H4R35_007323 [Dimargaris xerosporica]